MADSREVQWTTRSLKNAQKIRNYLTTEFSEKEASKFDELLTVEVLRNQRIHLPTLISKIPKIPGTSGEQCCTNSLLYFTRCEEGKIIKNYSCCHAG